MSRGAEASLREFVDLIKFATFACKLLNINTAVKVLMRQLYGPSWTAYTHWEARKCKLRPKFWLTKWLPFPCHLSYRPAKPGNLTADHHYFSSSHSLQQTGEDLHSSMVSWRLVPVPRRLPGQDLGLLSHDWLGWPGPGGLLWPKYYQTQPQSQSS